MNNVKQRLPGRIIIDTVGRTKKEVLEKQGKPTAIVGNVWLYNESTVIFDRDGKTKQFHDADGTLKREPVSNEEYTETLEKWIPGILTNREVQH